MKATGITGTFPVAIPQIANKEAPAPKGAMDKPMDRKQNADRRIPPRSIFLLGVFFLLWCLVIVRLFNLQIIDYDYYLNRVINNIQRQTTVSAERGIIYDCNMIPLATNETVWRVFISPRDIDLLENENPNDKERRFDSENPQAKLIASGLSELLGVDYNTVLEKAVKKNRADETIMRSVDDTTADDIRSFINKNGLSRQIYLEASSKRYYPFGTVASNVIGLVGTDGGLIGLELQYDSYLTGVSGKYITAKNAQSMNMPYKYDVYIDASNGANLVTTIDLTIQRALEAQLKDTYEYSDPLQRVVGVAMDVNTGAVRGMAVYPNFDLNDPYKLDPDSVEKLNASGLVEGSEEYNEYFSELLYGLWRNKAVSELYEPGSTFKVITASMAIEEKAVSWEDEFHCSTGGYVVTPGASPVHCWRSYGHGDVTFRYGLQQSCNPTLMQVAQKIGRETFYKYFQAYGYTEKTGVDLPGETYPIYLTYHDFNEMELAIHSFGQTFKVSPLQQITAISAVANGGNLMTPYLVEKIIDDDGNVLYQHEAEVRRQIVSKETAVSVAEVLEEGVSGDGAAKNAYVAGYKIAAKTGTSEKTDIRNEEGKTYLRVGSTVAFAPSDDPQIAALIVVDEPQCENIFGSYVAAPYVAKFMEDILPYIGVERNYSEEELSKINVTVKGYVGWTVEEAMLDISNRGIKCELKGDIDTTQEGVQYLVNYQIPSAGESLNKETGKIIIYTGSAVPEADIEVPNVVGMTESSARRTLVKAGLNVVYEGATQSSGTSVPYVVSMTPEAGTYVTYGTVVTVAMRYLDSED